MSSVGEEDIYQVGDEDRPDQGNGAEEEEGAEKEGNAESVSEDDEGLQTSFQRNRERCEMNTSQMISRQVWHEDYSGWPPYWLCSQPAPAFRPLRSSLLRLVTTDLPFPLSHACLMLTRCWPSLSSYLSTIT